MEHFWLKLGDIKISEMIEDTDSQGGPFWKRLDEPTIGHLWTTLRAAQHEVVRAKEVCSKCSDVRFCDHLRLESQSEQLPVIIDCFTELLQRLRYCWLCRLWCRIVARASAEDLFRRCVKENLPVNVFVDRGRWERQLLLSMDSSAPIGSYVRIIFPPGCRESRNFQDLQFHSVTTCHNLVSPPSRRFQKLQLDPDMRRRRVFDEVCRWITLCKSRHSTCRQQDTPFLSYHDGFRVIDVNTRKLCEPAVNCSYLALSYVWGSQSFSRPCSTAEGAPLLSDLIRKMRLGSELPQILPQTIEDAIIVTQSLGHQYLWADVLCIDQFNLSLKRKAIAAMGEIYSRALLTICVLDGSSMFAGIPGLSGPLWSRYQVITDTESDRHMFTQFRYTYDVLEASDWAKRAWTFQEGELSTRRLCFSEEGVFLRCKEEIFHDILELDEADDRRKGRLDAGAVHHLPLSFDLELRRWEFDTYARIVASYCHRSMSFPSDAYDAIRGAIEKMAENLSTRFVAALPVHDLCNALLWINRRNSFGPHREGRRRAGFPSWSWLGWEESIEYWYWLQKPTAKRESIFSLVDRDSNMLYHDAVRVQASATATFEAIAPDGSNAVLKLTTTIARFQIVKIMQSTPTTQQKDTRWLLLNQNGQKIGQETTFSYDGYHEYDGENRSTFCTLHLHSTTSAAFLEMNMKDLEFVFLQHWASNPSESVPEKFSTSSFPEDIPKHNRGFEDTVWTMAIRRGPDGVGERLDLVSIPAKAWFAVEPQTTVVSIA